MEKRVVLAMVVSVLFLMAYTTLSAQFAPPKPTPAGAGTVQPGSGLPGTDGAGTPQGGEDGGDPVQPGGDGAGIDGAGGPQPAAVPQDPEQPVVEETLATERLYLTATSSGGALRAADAWACEYHEPGSAEAVGDPGATTDWFEGQPGLLSVGFRGHDSRLFTRAWEIETRDDALIFRRAVTSLGVELVKTVRPSRDRAAPYHLDVELALRGLPESTGRRVTLEIVGPWLAEPAHPLPEDELLVARGGEDVETLSPSDVRESLSEDADHEFTAQDGVRWIGARSAFHLGALEPLDELPREATIGFVTAARDRADDPEQQWRSAAATIRIPVQLPRPGETERLRFRYYAGPNSRPQFNADDSPYKGFLDAVPERSFLGMSFGPITKVLAWLLTLLASTGIGYGLSVVFLTVFVRGALFPLSRKSQISMRVHAKRMGALKPKMDAIKAKYKDQRKAQEMTMKLMRQEKVSLLPGGCLLAFLQMPIWISLYGILQTTFEMRHATFLWAEDLTAADHLLRMSWSEGLPVLGGWLNLFPILMMITWGINAHMQPLPADPAQQQQAKMMRWMPMLFGVFLYNFACGLTLYMTMSALWSIGEVRLIKKVWLSKLDV